MIDPNNPTFREFVEQAGIQVGNVVLQELTKRFPQVVLNAAQPVIVQTKDNSGSPIVVTTNIAQELRLLSDTLKEANNINAAILEEYEEQKEETSRKRRR